MILLDGHSLTGAARVPAEGLELNLSERESAARLTVGPDAPELTTGQWLRDDTEPGAGIVWRVKATDRQLDTETVTYTLEHLIRSLADRIIPQEVKPSDMGGTGGACTARQAITYILGLQSDWTLGSLAAEYEAASNPYTFSGETLLGALETVSASLADPVWAFDFTVYPFRLSILKADTEASCEMRRARNITTMRVTIDRSQMYTRLYPVGKNNLKLPSPGYVERNTATWGVIEKTETDQSKDTQAALLAWANERIEKHAEPTVTVTITGLDFSDATGEPLDRLTIGKRCRVPLPELGVTMTEKITRLSWRDKIRDPESVQVTLANAPADVQSILRQDRAGGGKKARTDAEINEENVLILGDVESGLYTRIRQTASELRREAHDEAESMRTFVIQTASEVLQIAENDIDSLRTVVVQTASEWSASIEQVVGSDGRVTAASIAIAINNSTGETEAKIDAGRVYIGNTKSTTVISGKAEVTDLQATDAKIENVTVVEGSARYIQSAKVYATGSLSVGSGSGGGSGTFYFRGESYQKTSVVIKNASSQAIAEGSVLGTGGSSTPINLSHYHDITIEEGTGALAGKMVVTLGSARSTEGTANFNIADTQVYKDGVAAAREEVWVYYASTAGSGHQGTLTADSYICLGYEDDNGTVHKFQDVTWKTPAAPTVTLTGPTWAHADTSNANTVTVETSDGLQSKSSDIYMGQESWSGGSKNIYVYHTSDVSGNRVAHLAAEIPSNWGFSSDLTKSNTEPTGSFAKSYSWNVNSYKYAYFTINVGGLQHRVKLTAMTS